MHPIHLDQRLDELLPLNQVVRRQRTSDPNFEKECRDAKRLTRRLERAYAVASRWAATSPNVAVHSTVGPESRRHGCRRK